MIEPAKDAAATNAKRLKLDQVPAASLDADDPLDDDDSDEDSDEDDTEALMAELQRIKKERAAEQAKKVILELFSLLVADTNNLFKFNFRILKSDKKKRE